MADQTEAMLPKRGARPRTESALMRVIATLGVIAIGVVVAIIADAAGAQVWAIGLVTSLVVAVLAGVLWSSREL
jgi:hypothetical protein